MSTRVPHHVDPELVETSARLRQIGVWSVVICAPRRGFAAWGWGTVTSARRARRLGHASGRHCLPSRTVPCCGRGCFCGAGCACPGFGIPARRALWGAGDGRGRGYLAWLRVFRGASGRNAHAPGRACEWSLGVYAGQPRYQPCGARRDGRSFPRCACDGVGASRSGPGCGEHRGLGMATRGRYSRRKLPSWQP